MKNSARNKVMKAVLNGFKFNAVKKVKKTGKGYRIAKSSSIDDTWGRKPFTVK